MSGHGGLSIYPTEAGVDVKPGPYILRTPLDICDSAQRSEVLRTIFDTAELAFATSEPGARKVIGVPCTQTFKHLGWLSAALLEAGFDVAPHEPANCFAPVERPTLNTGNTAMVCCVDRRLIAHHRIQGVDPITQPGGALVLDPRMREHMPPDHVSLLRRAIQTACERGAPVSRLDHHVGLVGAIHGCAMVGKLAGSNPAVRERYQRPKDVVHMLSAVRDELGSDVDPNCKITVTVLSGDTSKDVVLNLDDAEEKERFLSDPRIAL